MLEPIRFDDGDIVEGSSYTPIDAEMIFDTEEDAVEESSGDHGDEYSDANLVMRVDDS